MFVDGMTVTGRKRPVLETGFSVDSFTIVKLLGTGGYGDCYEVVDNSDGTHWAMKVEYPVGNRGCLSQEWKIMRKYRDYFQFPKLLSTGETKEFSYIVMELFGPSLSQIRRLLPSGRYKA